MKSIYGFPPPNWWAVWKKEPMGRTVPTLDNVIDPKGWVHWLTLATAVHSNWINATTGLSPNQILLGYNPILNTDKTLTTSNTLVESRSEVMKQNCKNAIWALNKTSDQKGPLLLQYKPREQVWLDVSHLVYSRGPGKPMGNSMGTTHR